MIFRMQWYGPMRQCDDASPLSFLTAGFTPGEDEFPDISVYCLLKLLLQACLE